MGYEDGVIAGRYRLQGRIGQGAMGVVWRAQDERLGRLVALKHLIDDTLPHEATHPRGLERAIREARLAARLKHPHAVTVYDVIEELGSVYLVLEFLPSRSLTELLIDEGPLSPERVAKLGGQIASALAAAHAEGVLHRDVTPSNVLVTKDDNAMITDFGISHAVGEGTVTGSGLVIGTPAYVAPEVADGGESDFPSDVYGLGATLYTALEGAPPSGIGDNPIALLKRIARGDITPPRSDGPLAGVILRLLQRDPAERPSMFEAEALLTTAVTASPHTTTTTAPPPTPRWTRPRLVKAGSATVGLIVAAALIGVILVDDQGTPVAGGTTPEGKTTVTAEHTVRATATAEPAPTSVAIRTTVVRASPPVTTARGGCSASYELTSSWSGGAQATVTVHNDQRTAITGWTVTWSMPGNVSVRELWNGVYTQRGSTMTVTNMDWNGTVEPGASASFGLNENVAGNHPQPPSLTCR